MPPEDHMLSLERMELPYIEYWGLIEALDGTFAGHWQCSRRVSRSHSARVMPLASGDVCGLRRGLR